MSVVWLPVVLEVVEIIVDCFKPNVFAHFSTNFHYVFDTVITVQGIVIFVVYLCRKDVLRALQQRVQTDVDESEDPSAKRMLPIIKS